MNKKIILSVLFLICGGITQAADGGQNQDRAYWQHLHDNADEFVNLLGGLLNAKGSVQENRALADQAAKFVAAIPGVDPVKAAHMRALADANGAPALQQNGDNGVGGPPQKK